MRTPCAGGPRRIQTSGLGLFCPNWSGTGSCPGCGESWKPPARQGSPRPAGTSDPASLARSLTDSPGRLWAGPDQRRDAAELARLGFASATASFESRLAQIRDPEQALDLELLVYGRLPLMLMEHCILETGGQGLPLPGQASVPGGPEGEHFPWSRPGAAAGNELFNAKPLWLADKTDWRTAGAAYARLAFLREGPGECARVFRAYSRGGELPRPLPGALLSRGGGRSISRWGGVPFGRRWNGRNLGLPAGAIS